MHPQSRDRKGAARQCELPTRCHRLQLALCPKVGLQADALNFHSQAPVVVVGTGATALALACCR
jgi:hypothetical protein